MFIHRMAVAVFLCAVSAACSSSSEKLTKEIQDAASWIASARMVAKSYGDGAVPKAYAQDALASFSKQLHSTTKQVESISGPRALQTAAVLQRAQEAIAQINTSIEHDDQLSLSQFEIQLDTHQKQLGTLASPQAQPPEKP